MVCVVRSRFAPVASIARAYELLDTAGPAHLAVVLNAVDAEDDRAYGGHYYSVYGDVPEAEEPVADPVVAPVPAPSPLPPRPVPIPMRTVASRPGPRPTPRPRPAEDELDAPTVTTGLSRPGKHTAVNGHRPSSWGAR